MIVLCDRETSPEVRIVAAFEALLTIELRYVINAGRTLIQPGQRRSSLSRPHPNVAWDKSPMWRLPVSNPCDPYPATEGQIITYLQALELLDYHLNNPQGPWSSAWKLLVGWDCHVPGVKAVRKYLLYAGFTVGEKTSLERILVPCPKATQIAKRVLAKQLALERGHLCHHKHDDHWLQLRNQNAAIERAEANMLLKLGYDQENWFLTNLYDWAWATTDVDLRIIDSTESDWMTWWREWCRGNQVTFWWQASTKKRKGGTPDDDYWQAPVSARKAGRTDSDFVLCVQCTVLKKMSSFADAFKRNKIKYAEWRCLDCQYPACTKCQEQRCELKVPWQQQWGVPYCSDTCKWPVCSGSSCKTQRPRRSEYTYEKVTQWYCQKCRT